LLNDVADTTILYENVRQTYLKPENIEGFITLKRILDNIKDISDRLQVLHKYTTYDSSVSERKRHKVDYNSFIKTEPVKPQLLLDNLSLKSDIFRHSVRLSLAVIIGYLVSVFFPLGNSYWILLTIVVILKPEYSLTKKRNTDRLLGTISGVLIGFLVLLVVQNTVLLLVIMIIFMIGYFSTMRTNYLISVMLMTPYVVLFFHLLYPGAFPALLKDRIIDTVIGSAIAFTTVLLILPSWERRKINLLMTKMLEEDLKYFSTISAAFLKQKTVTVHNLHIARKDALVALANLSDAFNRMLSEPKSQQKDKDDIHQYVVLNHMFTSYVSTLTDYIKLDLNKYSTVDIEKVVEDIKQLFKSSIHNLKNPTEKVNIEHLDESMQKLNEQASHLLQQRKVEIEEGKMETSTKEILYDVKSVIDQFNLIYKVSKNINKVSSTINLHV
jgi:uncharacterized membrane protein YccC